MKEKHRLDELCVGECGKISALRCDGRMRRRFLDIGFAPGTAVVCLGRSPLGDPSLYLVRGCKIAIRNRDARGIEIREQGE